MKFIQPLILVLFLSICANTAFAADKADCYRIDSQEKVSVCANEILQDAPFIGPMLDALKTKYSTYFGSAIANTLLSNEGKEAVAGSECNTVIELKREHHAASPRLLASLRPSPRSGI